MAHRRALEGLAGLAHEVRALVAEIQVVTLEGPDTQEGPEDLVGLGTPGEAHLREEHEVPDGLGVKLEVLEDLHPEGLGTGIMPALDGPPVDREDLLHPHEELVLEEGEVRVTADLEEPEEPVASLVALARLLRGWVAPLRARARPS